MSIDLQKVIDSKRALRRDIAARPLADKLRMLDALRERAVTIQKASSAAHPINRVAELRPPYRSKDP